MIISIKFKGKGSQFSGQMYYPVDWYNQAGNGLTFGPKPESDYIFNFVGPYYPLPDEVCEGAEEGDAIECSPCRIQGCANYVYTNYTFIPGEPTLPDEMYDMDCATCLGLEETKRRKNPWTSPGSAPVYGEGCGANGGNPNGCMLPEVDNRPYGSCCVYVGSQKIVVFQCFLCIDFINIFRIIPAMTVVHTTMATIQPTTLLPGSSTMQPSLYGLEEQLQRSSGRHGPNTEVDMRTACAKWVDLA